MPGAWEMPRPGVLVSILTRELVATRWAKGFRELQLPPNSAPQFLTGMPFDNARNTACEAMLSHGFEWLFFLDDDVVCPPDTIQRLANHGKDIISGVYYRRAQPLAPVMMSHDQNRNAFWVTQYPANAVIEVDYVGAGCLLIHRRVLERVGKPWFEWQMGKPDMPKGPDGEYLARLSEDFAFCRKAKRDYRFGVHVDTSIQCEHIGLSTSTAAGLQPASVL